MYGFRLCWHILDRIIYTYLLYALCGDPTVMKENDIRFCKALQLTNMLRYYAKDLRINHCYLLPSMLEGYSLTPQDLLSTGSASRVLVVIQELARYTLAQFRDAIDYILAIRCLAVRLRQACLWPIMIGLEPLLLLRGSTS
ncbi:squalene/phytoene synthase family protein [Candidatus Vallotia tarda]|uniref:squalene/phytoene synthase family protein n=1 Tax=Candidatus Vallotiella hemipterorum TaxID=1177213 RepID=UPI002484CD48|nr:squalene/phytoene synthase family protein [Candidatus Vallotia tarda]